MSLKGYSYHAYFLRFLKPFVNETGLYKRCKGIIYSRKYASKMSFFCNSFHLIAYFSYIDKFVCLFYGKTMIFYQKKHLWEKFFHIDEMIRRTSKYQSILRLKATGILSAWLPHHLLALICQVCTDRCIHRTRTWQRRASRYNITSRRI